MRQPAGFTLVELLVASLLVALAVGSALTLVAQGRRAHRQAEARARLEETARVALDLLAHEVRHAGYLGALPPGTPVAGATPSGSAAPAGLDVAGGCLQALALDLAVPLGAADGTYAADNGLPLGCRPSPGGRSVTGADTLVVRRVATAETRAAAGRLQLESTRLHGRLMADGTPQLGTDASVHDLETSVFYVSADSTGSAGHPSLRRKRLVGGTAPAFQDEELVAGIGDLQVEAEPADGDATATYVPLAQLSPGARIRTLRLWVLARGDLPDGASPMRPPLAYAGREWPAIASHEGRLVASRVVEPRNAGARR